MSTQNNVAQIPYNAEFEDSLCAEILKPSPHSDREVIPVLSPDDNSTHGVRLADYKPDSSPRLDVPVPLVDPSRKYTSSVPGVLTTEPCGSLLGGPITSFSSDGSSVVDSADVTRMVDEYTKQFISTRFASQIEKKEVITSEEVYAKIQEEIGDRLKDIGLVASRRQSAKEKNEGVRAEIKVLEDQMELETKLLKRMGERARVKREREGRG